MVAQKGKKARAWACSGKEYSLYIRKSLLMKDMKDMEHVMIGKRGDALILHCTLPWRRQAVFFSIIYLFSFFFLGGGGFLSQYA